MVFNSCSRKVDFAARAGSIASMNAMIDFPNISPELFSISLFGMTFALRWYALAYIAGILIGWRLVVRTVNHPEYWKDATPVMTKERVEDLLFWVILGVILGGRLGYVLFYQPAYYLQNPFQILRIWEGGMSFHGGAIGVVVAFLALTTRHGLNKISTGDMVALGLSPGLLLGRLANFINAELWGRPTDLPWGVAFPTVAAQDCPDVLGICARHPSQLYEALLEGLILGTLLLYMAWRRGALKSPGLIGGIFLAGYGIAWEIGGYGLTMGQILCLPMIAVGAFFILRARRAT
jgi:phosphatidylglycerol:prolipoprotein diacylglycerol transferase